MEKEMKSLRQLIRETEVKYQALQQMTEKKLKESKDEFAEYKRKHEKEVWLLQAKLSRFQSKNEVEKYHTSFSPGIKSLHHASTSKDAENQQLLHVCQRLMEKLKVKSEDDTELIELKDKLERAI